MTRALRLICTACGDDPTFASIEAAKAHETEGENVLYGHEYVIEEES